MKIYNQEYQQKISAIYSEYRDIVVPLVAFLEANDAEFPVEILNELRSIFTHFSRIYENDVEDKEIELEIEKAQNHLKRAILDCYKYNSISLFDFYNKFRKEYQFADLSVIDNGDFLIQITKNFSDAKCFLLQAKLSERKNKDKSDLYSEYEKAFDLFLKNFNLINSKLDIVHKVSKNAKWKRFWGTFGFWISLCLGIISVILAFV